MLASAVAPLDSVVLNEVPLGVVVPTMCTLNEAPAARPHPRLNAAVAVTVAVLATFMGVCKVKDDNIVQAMQQAQADKLDHWNFYQARNIREEVAAAAVAQLELAGAGAAPAQQQSYHEAIAAR